MESSLVTKSIVGSYFPNYYEPSKVDNLIWARSVINKTFYSILSFVAVSHNAHAAEKREPTAEQP